MSALPPGPFVLVLADPPWAFRTFNGRNRTPTQKSFREAEDHYPTMTIDEMASIPVADVADRNALIAIWTVGSHVDAAFALAAAWGFDTFVTDLFYWFKQRLVAHDQIDLFTGDIAQPKMSMGYHTRKQVEPCYLFRRGKGLPVCAHDVRQAIVCPPTEHSRKPAEQYDRLERLYGDVPRLELFARNTRPGWSSWGQRGQQVQREPGERGSMSGDGPALIAIFLALAAFHIADRATAGRGIAIERSPENG